MIAVSPVEVVAAATLENENAALRQQLDVALNLATEAAHEVDLRQGTLEKAMELIDAQQTKNILLGACLTKSEAQRDALLAALERAIRDGNDPQHVPACVDNPTERPCCWVAAARAAIAEASR